MEVRYETGEVLARGEVGIEWADTTVGGLDASMFPILAGVCPYQDTVFNGWQQPILLAELDRLPVERQGPWVEALRAMCQVAAEGSHRYVWLVGD
jgi:hypothetical protein